MLCVSCDLSWRMGWRMKTVTLSMKKTRALLDSGAGIFTGPRFAIFRLHERKSSVIIRYFANSRGPLLQGPAVHCTDCTCYKRPWKETTRWNATATVWDWIWLAGLRITTVTTNPPQCRLCQINKLYNTCHWLRVHQAGKGQSIGYVGYPSMNDPAIKVFTHQYGSYCVVHMWPVASDNIDDSSSMTLNHLSPPQWRAQ